MIGGSEKGAMNSRRWHKRDTALVLTVVIGLASVVALARWMERNRPPVSGRFAEEDLYVTAAGAKRLSLGFNGLIADWYWMRALQYVGRKALNYQGEIQLDDLSPLNLKLLAPLLERTTTLDPKFMAAYEYGAIVLPAIDVEAAIKLTRKGIAANPQAWRLYHHLGYIYWQRNRFREASETYAAGARVPGAPSWMEAMAARMLVEGGSRDLARDMYMRMYTEAGDDNVKQLAAKRLWQIRSLDEQDVIRRVLADYRARTGRCPSAWREVAATLRAARLNLDESGAPLDPSGVAYELKVESCDVALDSRSEIPRK